MNASTQKEDHTQFLNGLEQFFNSHISSIPSSLQKGKKLAFEKMLALGLPTNKTEVYCYVPLQGLFSQSYAFRIDRTVSREEIVPFILPECTKSVLVFVNGRFQSNLSCLDALPKKLVVTSLTEAAGTYGAFLNNQWNQSLQVETDPLSAINASIYQEGAFIYLPPKTVVEAPIQILHIVHLENENAFLTPRVHVFVGSHSQLSITATIASTSRKKYCCNSVTEISLDENAHLQYTQMSEGLLSDVWLFDALRATLKKNSTLKTVTITSGSAAVRNDYRIELKGEGAEALLNGISMLSEKHTAHTNVLMDHHAPHCRSMQKYKNILNDFSRSSFEGKIMVRQPAQKTEAYQLNNNLLLNDRAHADSKPNLEIFADDVKASHGATFGQLDADHLFYMKSRGFSDADAKDLLIYGFCKDIADLISLPSLLQTVTNRTKHYLRRELQ